MDSRNSSTISSLFTGPSAELLPPQEGPSARTDRQLDPQNQSAHPCASLQAKCTVRVRGPPVLGISSLSPVKLWPSAALLQPKVEKMSSWGQVLVLSVHLHGCSFYSLMAPRPFWLYKAEKSKFRSCQKLHWANLCQASPILTISNHVLQEAVHPTIQ